MKYIRLIFYHSCAGWSQSVPCSYFPGSKSHLPEEVGSHPVSRLRQSRAMLGLSPWFCSKDLHNHRLINKDQDSFCGSILFIAHRARLTFQKSRGPGLSVLCLKYLLGFSQIDTSWFPKVVDFCIKLTILVRALQKNTIHWSLVVSLFELKSVSILNRKC